MSSEIKLMSIYDKIFIKDFERRLDPTEELQQIQNLQEVRILPAH